MKPANLRHPVGKEAKNASFLDSSDVTTNVNPSQATAHKATPMTENTTTFPPATTLPEGALAPQQTVSITVGESGEVAPVHKKPIKSILKKEPVKEVLSPIAVPRSVSWRIAKEKKARQAAYLAYLYKERQLSTTAEADV